MNYAKGTSVTYMEGVAEWVMLDTLATGFELIEGQSPLIMFGIKSDIKPNIEQVRGMDLVWENLPEIRVIRLHVADFNGKIKTTGAYIKRKYM